MSGISYVAVLPCVYGNRGESVDGCPCLLIGGGARVREEAVTSVEFTYLYNRHSRKNNNSTSNNSRCSEGDEMRTREKSMLM